MDASTLTAAELTVSADSRPLVVDLDGSLVRTDTLLECLVAALRHPVKLARAVLALRGGRAAFKAALATIATPEARRCCPITASCWRFCATSTGAVGR